MSEPRPSGSGGPDRARTGCGSVTLILIGIVLLFPGVCSLYYLHGELGIPRGGGNEAVLTEFFDVWVGVSVLIGVGGIVLILRVLWPWVSK
jgi:hypothetical protein